MAERLDSDCIIGLSKEDISRFIESDFRIHSGMCPNGCGLLNESETGQQCSQCGFFTNTPAERETQ